MSAGGILTVCDANICRSTAAEFLLAEGLASHEALADVDVFSSGVNALRGHRVCRLVGNLRDGESWAARATAHRARQLDAEAIQHADLILTATIEARSAVVSLVPQARRRVFTLREAVWLAEGYRRASDVTGEKAVQHFVAYLDQNRGLRTLPERRRLPWRRSQHPFDIADGHLRPYRAHIATVREVRDVTMQLVALIAQDSRS